MKPFTEGSGWEQIDLNISKYELTNFLNELDPWKREVFSPKGKIEALQLISEPFVKPRVNQTKSRYWDFSRSDSDKS